MSITCSPYPHHDTSISVSPPWPSDNYIHSHLVSYKDYGRSYSYPSHGHLITPHHINPHPFPPHDRLIYLSTPYQLISFIQLMTVLHSLSTLYHKYIHIHLMNRLIFPFPVHPMTNWYKKSTSWRLMWWPWCSDGPRPDEGRGPGINWHVLQALKAQ